MQLEKKGIDYDKTVFGLLHGSQLDVRLTEKFLRMAKERKSSSVQVVFHPFKPDKNEISFWDNYPAYKSYFSATDKEIEKINLLNNRTYFKTLTTP